MRIFYINSVCTGGSTGNIMCELARLVNNHGGETTIAFGRGRAAEDLATYRIGSRMDFYAHALKTRITGRTGTGSKRATKRLVDYMTAWKPDIVHLGNIHGYYVHLETLMEGLRRLNVPIVWTLHDCWSFTGHCAHFTDVSCERYRTGCHDCPKRRIYPTSWFFDRSRTVYAWKRSLFTGHERLTLVTPSNWLRDCVQDSFLRDYPVKVIPNGIDLGVFHPTNSSFLEEQGLMGKRIALGVATPWDERKGLYDMIALSERLPEPWRVVLVALTKKQIAALPKGIIGLERTENARALNEIYAAATAYVNPTYCDTFPTTNIEALAAGTPVVTYRVGGAAEALDTNCGLAVPLGDLDALEEAVLSSTAFSREDCVRRAAAFDKQERFMPYLSLYKSYLGEAGCVCS